MTQLGKFEKYLIEEFYDDYRAGEMSHKTFTRRGGVHHGQHDRHGRGHDVGGLYTAGDTARNGSHADTNGHRIGRSQRRCHNSRAQRQKPAVCTRRS